MGEGGKKREKEKKINLKMCPRLPFKNQLSSICFHDVLIHLCYCNKIPQVGGLIHNRSLFLTGL